MEAYKNPLIDAIRERRARATEVRLNYTIHEVGPGCFVVTHPDCKTDPDSGRSYLVDLLEDTCNCPDYSCRQDEIGPHFDCKHKIAIREIERKLGRLYAKVENTEQPDVIKQSHKGFVETLKRVQDDPYAD